MLTISNLEDHLHIVGGAEASNTSVNISGGGGGDKIIILSRFELQSSRSGTKVAEGDGEVLELLGFVTDGYDCWSMITDPTRVKVFLGDAIDHVLFACVLGTDQVELIVLPR